MTSLPVVNQPPRPVGPLLEHLVRRVRACAEGPLNDLGLRARHVMALTVLREGGSCGQQYLAGALSMDSTNVVGLLNELEQMGLIRRTRDAEDRRRHIVELTDAGQHQLIRAGIALNAAEDQVLGALTTDQRVELYELLRRASVGCPGLS